MPLDDNTMRAQLLPLFPTAKALDQSIERFGGPSALWAFRNLIGAATLRTIAVDYYPERIKSLYDALPADRRAHAFQLLAGLSQLSRQRLRDMYPHTMQSTGGYTLNIDCQRNVLLALGTTTNPVGFGQGGNLPMNPVSGLLDDVNWASRVYTVLGPGGQAQKNYIFDANGMGIAEVDFANHGSDAVSGHCHAFGLPGQVWYAHHDAGGMHLGLHEYPIVWRQLPGGINPIRALGT